MHPRPIERETFKIGFRPPTGPVILAKEIGAGDPAVICEACELSWLLYNNGFMQCEQRPKGNWNIAGNLLATFGHGWNGRFFLCILGSYREKISNSSWL